METFGLPVCFKSRQCDYKKSKSYSFKLRKIIENYFSKKFNFNCKDGVCLLPDPSTCFVEEKWKIAELQTLKDQLNSVKSKLNNLDLKEWHTHTQAMNRAGDVQNRLRRDISPEFLTQAWCKFYEVVASYPLIPDSSVQQNLLNSVHLCEAPGAFVTSLNHYLQLNHPTIQWNWLATTLNPYHEGNPLSQMINNDRFILHTLRHWDFGEDCTGNLQDIKNMESLMKTADTVLDGQVMLVTADGSVDCQTNPAEQECMVSSLHYCETIAALHMLSPGGSLLIKMFTLFECETICLLYLIYNAFTTIEVFKPATSKEGNSEVYVICLGYKGQEVMSPWLHVLRKHYGTNITNKALFPKECIPDTFINEVKTCASLFVRIQMSVINRNLETFKYPWKINETQNRIIRQLVSDNFIVRYNVCPLNFLHMPVIGNNILMMTPALNLDRRVEDGSFNDRQRKTQLNRHDSLQELCHTVEGICTVWPFKETIQWLEFNDSAPQLEIEVGEPVLMVNSSKFCLGSLLQVRNSLAALMEHNYSSESQLELKSDNSIITLDVSQIAWEKDTAKAQTAFLQGLKEITPHLSSYGSVNIHGLPLLTQFTVAVVFMFAHSFTQVGFEKPESIDCCIKFEKFRGDQSSLSWLHSLLHVMCTLSKHQSVLSILPINILCRDRFYSCVTSFNHIYMKNKLKHDIEVALSVYEENSNNCIDNDC